MNIEIRSVYNCHEVVTSLANSNIEENGFYEQIKPNLKEHYYILDRLGKLSIAVMSDNDIDIGYAVLIMNTNQHTSREQMVVESFYIKKNFRKYSARFMKFIEVFSKEKGCNEIIAAYPINDTSIGRWFRMNGFAEVEVSCKKEI